MSLYPVQDAFIRGEISPRLHSRASLDLYRAALAECRNFITLPHGGLRKRGGGYFVAPTKNASGTARLIDFRFSQDQAYCLEFGHQYCRVYAYGQFVTEFGTPWSSSQLAQLQYAQSADVMWVVHPAVTPRKITRLAHASWSVDKVSFTDGPFGAVNLDESIRVYASAATGSDITITASADIFQESDIDRLFRIEMESYRGIPPWEPFGRTNPDVRICRYDGNVYALAAGARFGGTPPTHTKGTEQDGPKTNDPSYSDVVGLDLTYLHSGFGVARITSFTDAQHVQARVMSRFPDEVVGSSNSEYLYSFGAFSNGDYPVAVTLFEERLCFASKLSVYASRTGDFSSFRIGEKDDDALQFLLAANEANNIVWMADADGYLAIGTTGGVRALAGSGVDEALTPSSFKNRASATQPCSSLRPLGTGRSFVYVTAEKMTLSEMVVNTTGRFEGADASQISEHIAKQGGGIVDTALQNNPDPIVWAVMANGELMGFTYQPDQSVRGFHRHLGGDAQVLSVCVTPAQQGPDDVWVVVRRTVNGVSKQFIELLQPSFEYGNKVDVFAVDAGLSYRGSAVGTVSGLSHLNGATVSALANGFRYDGLTVSGNALTLPDGKTATTIHVGLPYDAAAATLELDAGGRDGSIIGRRKKVHKVILSLLETDLSGLQVQSLIKKRWEKAKLPSIAVQDGSIQLFTGNITVNVEDSWEGMGQIRIRHQGPGPCTIRSIVPVFDSEGS